MNQPTVIPVSTYTKGWGGGILLLQNSRPLTEPVLVQFT